MSKYLESSATFSDCRRFRYTLRRVWDPALPVAAFIGLNPSTADEKQDDPTIRRCISFARANGFGTYVMLNLWAYRTTFPHLLPTQECPEEDRNLEEIIKETAKASRTIACWGVHPKAILRYKRVVKLISEIWCLGTTVQGQPLHPLYLPKTSEMRLWLPPRNEDNE